MEEVFKFYMNNLCKVVREINDELSEVIIYPEFADSVEGSQWCHACMVGSIDGFHPTHTCEPAQEIIDHINDTQTSMCVIVENHLLHDSVVEFKSWKRFNDEVENLRERKDSLSTKLNTLNDQVAVYEASLMKMREEEVLLKESISRKKEILDGKKKDLYNLDKTIEKRSKVSVENYEISVDELKDWIHSSVELQRLEAGGVDNWGRYGESLYPDGEPEIDVEVLDILASYKVEKEDE
jgi:hypothetical protein